MNNNEENPIRKIWHDASVEIGNYDHDKVDKALLPEYKNKQVINTVTQICVCLEEIAEVYNRFKEEVVNTYGMVSSTEHICEIQRRGIGINFDFGEEIHRSDDEVTYYLKDDKLVAFVLIRRTEFNNAEITMVKTGERQFKYDKRRNNTNA